MTILLPHPGQIYRHKKHDPAAGHWHEYEVVKVIEPGMIDPDYIFSGLQEWRHTTTHNVHVLYGRDRYGVCTAPNLELPHVAYKKHPSGPVRSWLGVLLEANARVCGWAV